MALTASLSTKFVRVGVLLLLIEILCISVTLWVTKHLDRSAVAVHEAQQLRMQTRQLTGLGQAERTPDEVNMLVQDIDQRMNSLRQREENTAQFMPWNESVATRLGTSDAMWVNQRAIWLQDIQPKSAQVLDAVDSFGEATDALVLTIEKRLSGFINTLNLLQIIMLAVALGGTLVMFHAGYKYVVSPLVRLREGLHQLEAGNFKVRMEVDTLDEIGHVARGFNRMASKLQSVYAELESLVDRKTRHIEGQRARLETLYEASAFMANANNIEELARGFSKRVRAAMKADAVALRWSDEGNQRYLMLASDCLPKDVAEQEGSLRAGTCACGNLPHDARTRVIPIRHHGKARTLSCVRAGFDTMVSVPVRLKHCLVGEINLFSGHRPVFVRRSRISSTGWPTTWPMLWRVCASPH